MSCKITTINKCTCGNPELYKDQIAGVISAPMVPLNTCMNCNKFEWDEKTEERFAKAMDQVNEVIGR